MESKPCLKTVPKVVIAKSPSSNGEERIGLDGGWAWCVAFAACLINFIMAGLARMSGILYVAFIDMFHVDRKGASMPFSVRSSTRNLLGPVVGILGQKYGVRTVTIIGGIIGSLSAATCFFAEDIIWITVIWGGINGAGTALTTTLIQVVIGQHFDKYRTTASGMAFSGGCVGSFVFPVLLEELLHSYGIEGTFLIIGGIIMHCIPAAMILRKPIWLKSGGKNLKAEDLNEKPDLKPSTFAIEDRSNKVKESIDIPYLRQNGNIVLQLLSKDPINSKDSKETNPSEKEILKEMEDVYTCFEKKMDKSEILLDSPKVKDVMRSPVSVKLMNGERQTCAKSFSFTIERNMSVIDRFDSATLNRNPSTPDTKFNEAADKEHVMTKLQQLCKSNESRITSQFSDHIRDDALRIFLELQKLNGLCARGEETGRAKSDTVISMSPETKTIVNTKDLPTVEAAPEKKDKDGSVFGLIMMAFKLYTKPLFLLICMCRAVHFISFVPVITTIVDFAMDKGLQEDDGKYVIGALSLGDLLGRLCFGWVTDRGFATLPKYMMIVMVIQAATTASLPLMYAKATLLPTLALFGMLQGSVFVRHPVLVSKYMDSKEQSIAMGCVNFLSGFLGFGLPLYIGYFRDTIGSYNYIYYINGTLGALVGLLWIFEPYFVRCSKSSKDVPASV